VACVCRFINVGGKGRVYQGQARAAVGCGDAAPTHQSACSCGNLQFLGVATIGHVGMSMLSRWLRGLRAWVGWGGLGGALSVERAKTRPGPLPQNPPSTPERSGHSH